MQKQRKFSVFAYFFALFEKTYWKIAPCRSIMHIVCLYTKLRFTSDNIKENIDQQEEKDHGEEEPRLEQFGIRLCSDR